jgi:hypothetical protein
MEAVRRVGAPANEIIAKILDQPFMVLPTCTVQKIIPPILRLDILMEFRAVNDI